MPTPESRLKVGRGGSRRESQDTLTPEERKMDAGQANMQRLSAMPTFQVRLELVRSQSY